MIRIVHISVSFHIAVCITAESNGRICLTTCNGYLAAADLHLTGSTGPGELIRYVGTVLQPCRAVHLRCTAAKIGFVFRFLVHILSRCLYLIVFLVFIFFVFFIFILFIVFLFVILLFVRITAIILIFLIWIGWILLNIQICDLFQSAGIKSKDTVIPQIMALGMSGYCNACIQGRNRYRICIFACCIWSKRNPGGAVSLICFFFCAHKQIIIAYTAKCKDCCHHTIFGGKLTVYHTEHKCAGGNIDLIYSIWNSRSWCLSWGWRRYLGRLWDSGRFRYGSRLGTICGLGNTGGSRHHIRDCNGTVFGCIPFDLSAVIAVSRHNRKSLVFHFCRNIKGKAIGSICISSSCYYL